MLSYMLAGALYTDVKSSVGIAGTTYVTHNSAVGDGGMALVSELCLEGRTIHITYTSTIFLKQHSRVGVCLTACLAQHCCNMCADTCVIC